LAVGHGGGELFGEVVHGRVLRKNFGESRP